jgi:hypothetical protein
MKIDEVVEKLKDQNFLILPKENLEEILAHVSILEDKDTLMSDHIRILKWNDVILVQEITSKNELAIRIVDSIEQANHFVGERMETYERMWDGCGCKVNYYE